MTSAEMDLGVKVVSVDAVVGAQGVCPPVQTGDQRATGVCSQLHL